MLYLSRELRDVPGLRLFLRAEGAAQLLAVELTVRIAGGPFVVVVPVPAAAGEVAFTSLAAHPRVFDPLCAAVSPNLPGRIHADNVFERVAAHLMWQAVEPRLVAVAREPGELVRVGVPEAVAANLVGRHAGWVFTALAVAARPWGPDVVQIAPFLLRYTRSDARLYVPGVAGAPRASRTVLAQARLRYADAGWVSSQGAIGVMTPEGLVNPARPVLAAARQAVVEDLWLEERMVDRPRPWSFREARAAVVAAAAREAERLAAEAEQLAAAAAAAIEAAVAGKGVSPAEVALDLGTELEEVTDPEVTAPELTAPLEPELELDPDDPVEEDTRPG